jgi:hypothetical protein
MNFTGREGVHAGRARGERPERAPFSVVPVHLVRRRRALIAAFATLPPVTSATPAGEGAIVHGGGG